MLTPNLAELQKLYPNLVIIHGTSLERSIEQCDIVLSGNSNVHREVLRAGVPSLYVSYLDTVEYDYWGLVRNRITLEAADLKDFSLDHLQRFHDTSWADRFSAYDASYLEDLPTTQARVKREIDHFISGYHDFRAHSANRSLPDSATLSLDAIHTLTLRPARLEDSTLLLGWRNEEAVRQNSANPSEISEETHARWYASVLNSSLSKMYILMRGEIPVGQIRFDLKEGVAVLSYSIDRLYRGQGLGAFLVAEGVQRAMRDFGSATIIRALVKPTNTPSLEALRKVGFVSRGLAPSGALIFESNHDKLSRARAEERKASA
jgi:RimJ/RimL family protein N-acetyltransferase